MPKGAKEGAVEVRPEWGERVREALRFQGRTMVWLAESVGMRADQFAHMLNSDDRRYIVTRDLLERVAEKLGIPPSMLFTEAAPPTDGGERKAI